VVRFGVAGAAAAPFRARGGHAVVPGPASAGVRVGVICAAPGERLKPVFVGFSEKKPRVAALRPASALAAASRLLSWE